MRSGCPNCSRGIQPGDCIEKRVSRWCHVQCRGDERRGMRSIVADLAPPTARAIAAPSPRGMITDGGGSRTPARPHARTSTRLPARLPARMLRRATCCSLPSPYCMV